jgi:hypothetical protein
LRYFWIFERITPLKLRGAAPAVERVPTVAESLRHGLLHIREYGFQNIFRTARGVLQSECWAEQHRLDVIYEIERNVLGDSRTPFRSPDLRMLKTSFLESLSLSQPSRPSP